MKITEAEVRKVLDGLPVGYYCGREVPVSLSKTEPASGYNLVSDEITFSLPQLQLAAANCPDNIDHEKAIRTMLYHELSHAILTPKNLRCRPETNIFEDERIETLLSDYYLNVDFKELVGMMVAGSGEPETQLQGFFNLVRLREAKTPDDEVLLESVKDIINNAAKLKRGSDEEGYWYGYNVNYTPYDYERDILRLFKDYCNCHPELKCDSEEQKRKYMSGNPNNPNGENSEGSGDGDKEQDKDGQGNQEGKGYDENEMKKRVEEAKNKQKEGKDAGRGGYQAIQGSMDQYIDKNLGDKLERIFAEFKSREKANAAATTAYTGSSINIRAFCKTVPDYKFFVRKAQEGGLNGFSKFHLNLFIDRSGSFSSNTNVMRKVLKTLYMVSKKFPDFSYSIVSCGDGQNIEDINNYFYSAYDGTHMTDNIKDIYREVQRRDAVNYTIVMYDGYCSLQSPKLWTTFNSNNVTIISDTSNQDNIAKQCPAAHTIFTNRYAEELIDNIVTTLQTAFK